MEDYLMSKYASVLELIGNTPVVRLSRLFPDHDVWLKLERANPGGSVKDRIALQMVLDAVARGDLKKGGTIIEPTSGNTGVGLAMVSAGLPYDSRHARIDERGASSSCSGLWCGTCSYTCCTGYERCRRPCAGIAERAA